LPFKSADFSDSAFSRLISTPNTPLVDIGLIMLGKQFAQNFQSNLAQELIPTINLRNLFDGDSETKLFQKKIKYNITRKTEGGTLDGFVEDFFGYQPKRDNVFNFKTTNAEYLENTGVGQLDYLFGSVIFDESGGGLNKNIYKPSGQAYVDIAKVSGNKIADRKNVVNNLSWFNTYNTKVNQYNPFTKGVFYGTAEIDANAHMIDALKVVTGSNQEYAPSNDFIDDNFGKTVKGRVKNFDPKDNSGVISDDGFNSSTNSQLVWGRDGVDYPAKFRLSKLNGIDLSDDDDVQKMSNFNVKSGLLEYTRNLLNATEGQVVDQTRKIFENRDGFQGMNGSSLWNSNETDYSEKSGFAGNSGLRQHSVLDQYDRFAKAIRFDGNEHYGGNPNSVVNKSVLPRIHPTEDNNKNLMFSLENLAIRAFKTDSNIAIIDDEYGTEIPSSEVGPSGGRYMWFPPYAIELNESTAANYDSTVLIGRNEPIYSYINSERSANLKFKLIIDYPEQVKNYLKTASHKDLAEFFAFGGDKYDPNAIKKNADKSEEDKEDEIVVIEGPVRKLIPEITLPIRTHVYFPNDVPTAASADVIDDMYQGLYEAQPGLTANTNNVLYDDKSYGLNQYTIYNPIGIENDVANIPVDFKQSEADYKPDTRLLDDKLFNVYSDPENSKYYKIFILGQATKLYTPNNPKDISKGVAFNLDLSRLRAETVKKFIEKRIKKIFDKSAESLGIKIETAGSGDRTGSDENVTFESISSRSAKKERSAIIKFVTTGVTPEKKYVELPPEDKKAVKNLKSEKQNIQSTGNSQKKNHGSGTMEERLSNKNSGQDQGILGGFKSITDNHFYPTFHSQTPEDFHKRLTFLQQCMRQGSAVRSHPEKDEQGVTRVKNSTFGRQPICVLRIADFFHTKVIIENLTIDYDDTI